MYTAILVVLIGIAAFFLLTGITRKSAVRIGTGIAIGVATALFFWFMDFYGELLWFEAIGYEQRFWKTISFQFIFMIAGFILGAGILFLLLIMLPQNKHRLRIFMSLGAGVITAIWGAVNWELLLRFWYQVPAELADPIFDQNISFYLFTLPFLEQLFGILVFLVIIGIITTFIAGYIRLVDNKHLVIEPPVADPATRRRYTNTLFFLAGMLMIVLAFGKYIDKFQLMYSSWGAVNGPGWTDVNIRIPAYWIVIGLTILVGLLLIIPAGRKLWHKLISRLGIKYDREHPAFVLSSVVVLFGLWFLALTAIPGIFQWLRVSPNEITYERPYILNNIALTRHAFGLHHAENREFPAADQFTPEMVERNQSIFNNIRLWDWRALDNVYKQFQEIRLYYEFQDVDIDRYYINDTMRQVMVSARELQPKNLPQQSQTFVNTRFKYTHGYGITLNTVNEFTQNGLPNLLIKNIPPESTLPELEVKRPEIYYGELTEDYVIANSKEMEFDYPKGDENVYVKYQGKGGVQLSNFFRKFIYGWKFEGTKMVVSSYPTKESRIMFHRNIHSRVKKLAPFLHFDDDPYIVLSEGKLYWMIDAYTTSNYFPYSEPYNSNERIPVREDDRDAIYSHTVNEEMHGINYIRNSVKVVVDAYHGTVDFYIYDESDVLIKVWDRIFPGLLKNKEEMPETLRRHVRYPTDMLLMQGMVYAKYHMNDPTVFYNQEDLWVRATEKYYGSMQPVDPYYVIWQFPEDPDPQFILMLPFTPKNRQVMIGWIAAMCDPENYGRFLTYEFPKQKRVLGPQQVETKIDQDRFLSGQLTLWDQRGSSVIRGNVLAIPVENTLFYVEPIYLQSETAAYPELRLVIVMHEDNLSYGNTFEEALAGLFEKTGYPATGADPEAETEDDTAVTEQRPRVPAVAPGTMQQQELIERANQAFDEYTRATGNKEFERASRAMEELQKTLRQLMQQNTPDTTGAGQ